MLQQCFRIVVRDSRVCNIAATARHKCDEAAEAATSIPGRCCAESPYCSGEGMVLEGGVLVWWKSSASCGDVMLQRRRGMCVMMMMMMMGGVEEKGGEASKSDFN